MGDPLLMEVRSAYSERINKMESLPPGGCIYWRNTPGLAFISFFIDQ